jgi:hypothetical protein
VAYIGKLGEDIFGVILTPTCMGNPDLPYLIYRPTKAQNEPFNQEGCYRQVSIIIGESMAIIRVRGALKESWAGCPVPRSGPINDPMELHEFLRGHTLYLFNFVLSSLEHQPSRYLWDPYSNLKRRTVAKRLFVLLTRLPTSSQNNTTIEARTSLFLIATVPTLKRAAGSTICAYQSSSDLRLF